MTLLLAGGGLWLIGRHPGAAIGGLVVIAGIAALVMIGQRRRQAGYRAALLEAGARDPMQLSPIEYENFCALLLTKHGWTVETTKASGDYGADILARSGRTRMVVQCKRYAKPVGVAAIQQAHTAIAHYRADRAAVMATRGFTKAARTLAASTGTVLIVPGESDLRTIL